MDRSKDRERALRKALRNARKALQIAHRADWMVTCDWTDGDRRDEMWDDVRLLAGIRNWSYANYTDSTTTKTSHK